MAKERGEGEDDRDADGDEPCTRCSDTNRQDTGTPQTGGRGHSRPQPVSSGSQSLGDVVLLDREGDENADRVLRVAEVPVRHAERQEERHARDHRRGDQHQQHHVPVCCREHGTASRSVN